MLGGLEQQIADTSKFPLELVIAIIGFVGTLGAAWIVSRRRKK